jgi:hypothetical protein
MHGGLSTGPRTPAGLARSKRARWKHGAFSVEARQEMAHFRQLLRECNEVEDLMISGGQQATKVIYEGGSLPEGQCCSDLLVGKGLIG